MTQAICQWYIEPEWLTAIDGQTLYYPAADSDLAEPIETFSDHISTFIFCDPKYPRGLRLEQALPSDGAWRLLERKVTGQPHAELHDRIDPLTGRKYRYLSPSKLIETYQRADGRCIEVIRRRGFGQIPLSTEFPPRSVGVFMHRGDTFGEGGSGVMYLANTRRQYAPCSRLYGKLARVLTDRALVVTDGLLTKFRPLRRQALRGIIGQEAFLHHQDRRTSFIRGDFLWTCVGWLGARNRPTLVWGLTRQDT